MHIHTIRAVLTFRKNSKQKYKYTMRKIVPKHKIHTYVRLINEDPELHKEPADQLEMYMEYILKLTVFEKKYPLNY